MQVLEVQRLQLLAAIGGDRQRHVLSDGVAALGRRHDDLFIDRLHRALRKGRRRKRQRAADAQNQLHGGPRTELPTHRTRITHAYSLPNGDKVSAARARVADFLPVALQTGCNVSYVPLK